MKLSLNQWRPVKCILAFLYNMQLFISLKMKERKDKILLKPLVIKQFIKYQEIVPFSFHCWKHSINFHICTELRKVLWYCTELRRHVHSRTTFARWPTWEKNPAAIFLCRLDWKKGETIEMRVNAGKLIRRNLPFIWNKIKNIAVPNSQDIQEISNSQRHANGAGFASTPLFG